MKKYPWPWEAKFSHELFTKSAAELVDLINADLARRAQMPDVLSGYRTMAVKVATSLSRLGAARFALPHVPVPAVFSINGTKIEWRADFPTIDALIAQEAARRRRTVFSVDDVIPAGETEQGIGEGVRKLMGAFSFLLALSLDDSIRYRLKRCSLISCGRFFVDRSARSGTRRKGERRSFCRDRRCAVIWLRSDEGRRIGSERTALARKRLRS